MANLDKIKDRIAKLLAMAKDTSSPNEAAIAAARARKLMDAHQLDNFDIEEVKAEMVERATDKPYKFTPAWKDILSVAVAKYNDCLAACRGTNRDRYSELVFRGYSEDVQMAEDMYKTLVKSCEDQCKAYMISQGMGSYYVAKVGDAFKKGWSRAICQTLRELTAEREQLEAPGGTSLMVIKMDLVEQHFGPAGYVQARIKSRVDEECQQAVENGWAAGKRQEINRKLED